MVMMSGSTGNSRMECSHRKKCSSLVSWPTNKLFDVKLTREEHIVSPEYRKDNVRKELQVECCSPLSTQSTYQPECSFSYLNRIPENSPKTMIAAVVIYLTGFRCVLSRMQEHALRLKISVHKAPHKHYESWVPVLGVRVCVSHCLVSI